MIKSIIKKNKLYKKYCNTKDILLKRVIFTEFKNYRNCLTVIKRQSKDNYYKKYFKENKNNARKIWEGIKQIIDFNPKQKQSINSIQGCDGLVTDGKIMAEQFNNYFSNIAKEIDEKIIPTNKNFEDYLKNVVNIDTFSMNPVTPADVEDYISTLKDRKSSGPHSIPNNILKLAKKELSIPLSLIFNMSFETGVFPNKLKEAEIVPVFKNGDKCLQSNYRPISLLSNISKILEKVVRNRYYKFLETHKCFNNYQFGFREIHSTNHAFIALIDKIQNIIDNNGFACSVFIDLKKAFDTVNHKILLRKLSFYGIRGNSYKWFESYLCRRFQYTKTKGFSSSIKEILYGVPQGSVLGPLLFLLYINDLHKALRHSFSILFADDTNLTVTSRSLKEINWKVNHDLTLLNEWLRANRISLNAKKTELILFRSKTNPITKHFNFRLSGQKIMPVTKIKYLGLIFDEHLTWAEQLTIIKAKVSRATGLLAKLRHSINEKLNKMIYSCIFHSHILYGCQLWGQRNSSLKNKIANIQNTSLQKLCFKDNQTPVEHLYKKMKILPLEKQVFYSNTVFVYDSLNRLNPKVFNNIFVKSVDVHDHMTRGANFDQLVVPRVNSYHFGLCSTYYCMIKDWNNLLKKIFANYSPLSLKRSSFLKKLKDFLTS